MERKSSRSGTQHPDVAAIAETVRRVRKEYGLTQVALAGLAGTGVRFISDLERGKQQLSLDKVVDVLAALGLRLVVVS